MAAQQVALILGAGYKVAVASRKGTGSTTAEGYLSLQADFTKPESIPGLFEATKAVFNVAPNVVVYNAAALTPPPDNNSAVSIPLSSFKANLNINTVTPYAAAQEAVKGWETLPSKIKKTLNTTQPPNPLMLNLGVGKSASMYWLAVADVNYAAGEYRFFYTDERNADASFMYNALNGDAHAEFFAQLARHEGNVPWLATFIKGKGHVNFD